MADFRVDTEEGLLAELRENGLLASPPRVRTTKPKPKLPEVELDAMQRKAVNELDTGKILVGGTGVGKSRTAAAWYMAGESLFDVYVITTAKKRDSFDWEEEFNAFGVSTNADLSIAGKLTVDSWNNIGRYEDVKDAVFIFDEQRLVGTGAWTLAFGKIAKRNRWILLSATPGDTWLDYIPVFVANGFYRNRTEFKREHVVYARFAKFPKVDRYLGEDKLLRLRQSIQVEMPYTPHTTRHTHYVPVEYDKESLHRAMVQRWHVYEERPIRDVAELFIVMRKIVNSDPSRLEAVRCLMQKHPKLIVFYNFNYELEMLRELGRLASEVGQKKSLSSISYFMNDSGALDGSTTAVSPKAPSNHTEEHECPTDQYTQSSTRSFSFAEPSQPSSFTEEGTSRKSSTSTITSPDGSKSIKSSSIDGKDTDSSSPSSTRSSSLQEPELLKEHECLTIQTLSGTTPRFSNSSTRPLSLKKKLGSSSRSQSTTKSGSGLSSTTDSPNTSEAGSTSEDELLSTTRSFEVAEWNGQKHQPIPETDSWLYLVQYTAGAEGWNCTETDAMAFWSLTYSYKSWHQAYGRIDRRNTKFKDLNYYVLKSNSPIDSAILQSLKDKKSFNENSMGIKF